MLTSPAPSLPRADRPLARRDREVLREVDRDDPAELAEVEGKEGLEGEEGPEGTEMAGAASPQTVQYPSSMVPPQLAQVLIFIVLLFASH
jgi:hypothetical protein